MIISSEELLANGYTEIVSQDDEEVVLRTEEGGLELFAIRDSFSGWCLDTTDGRVLEFVSSKVE